VEEEDVPPKLESSNKDSPFIPWPSLGRCGKGGKPPKGNICILIRNFGITKLDLLKTP
jgi:hypothetical protein